MQFVGEAEDERDDQSGEVGFTPHHNTRIKRQLTGLSLGVDVPQGDEGEDFDMESDGPEICEADGTAAAYDTFNPLSDSDNSGGKRLPPSNLRTSILKVDYSKPVVSPRTPLTRSLSFADQAGSGPLKEVRLYEKPPKVPRLMTAPAFEQQQNDFHDDNKFAIVAFIVAMVLLFIVIMSRDPD